MIQTNEWLPIGSVVHLRGRNGLLMVIACMVGEQATGALWDYAAVPYPQGVTGPSCDVMFDKEGIDGVFAFGLLDEDGVRMQELLRSAEVGFEASKRMARGKR